MRSSLTPRGGPLPTLVAMDGPPIAVVGGGVAGMAAAARLAKVGHAVDLYEQAGVLGGSWAPYRLADGVWWTMPRRSRLPSAVAGSVSQERAP